MAKRFIAFFVALSCIALGVPSAAAGELEGVRHSHTAERTRIVLDLSADSAYKIRRVESPERIVLEIPATRLLRSAPVVIGDGRVKSVRFNRLSNRVQVVLDLDSRLAFRHFALAPSGSKPARIVVDVMGELAPGAMKTPAPTPVQAAPVPGTTRRTSEPVSPRKLAPAQSAISAPGRAVPT